MGLGQGRAVHGKCNGVNRTRSLQGLGITIQLPSDVQLLAERSERRQHQQCGAHDNDWNRAQSNSNLRGPKRVIPGPLDLVLSGKKHASEQTGLDGGRAGEE